MFSWGTRARQTPEKPQTGPAVIAFGKVPALPEYVRAGPPSPVSTAVEDWFVQATEWGAHYRAARWRAEFDAGLPRCFVLHGEHDSSILVVGVAMPSHDSVGRRFPLVLYALVHSQPLLFTPHLAPLLFRDFFEDATGMLRALAGSRSTADFTQLVGRVSLPDTSGVQRHDTAWRYWSETPSYDLFEDLFATDPIESAQRALHAILDAASPFRGKESPPTSLGLRLPLSPRNAGMSAAFWLEAVRICAGWTQTIPVWFSPEISGATSLLVQLGDQPPHSAMADLWMPDPAADQVCDLTSPPALRTMSVSVPWPAPLGAVVDDPEATIGNVLAALRN